MNWLQRMHGLGVRPLAYVCDEVLDDLVLEDLAEVQHVVGDVELVGDAARVLDRAEGAARVLALDIGHIGQSGQTLSVTPTTSWPACLSSAAVTEVSTPPDMPTMTRAIGGKV